MPVCICPYFRITRLFSKIYAFILCLISSSHADNSNTPVWSYFESKGPTNWGELSKEFKTCSQGSKQSPVDLGLKDVIETTAAKERLTFDYLPSPLEITDTGHGIQVNLKTMSKLLKHKTSFRLVQFHFHSPSEHTWNKNHFPMEIHFVHRSIKGELAVIGALIREGPENPEINKIIENLPKKGATVGQAQVQIDPLKLLPQTGGYLTYSGSLTTPPCTEDVQWHVLGAPITLSARQISALASRYSFNARPVQDLGTRKITVVK